LAAERAWPGERPPWVPEQEQRVLRAERGRAARPGRRSVEQRVWRRHDIRRRMPFLSLRRLDWQLYWLAIRLGMLWRSFVPQLLRMV